MKALAGRREDQQPDQIAMRRGSSRRVAMESSMVRIEEVEKATVEERPDHRLHRRWQHRLRRSLSRRGRN